MAPELEEGLGGGNSIKRAQNSLLDTYKMPQTPSFDFERWWKQEFWQHYPLKVDEIAAKKVCRVVIENGRGDGLKATPDELVAGVLRFAGAMMGTPQRYIMYPTKWLEKGRWTDIYEQRAGFSRPSASASTEAVYRAGEAMAAGNRRTAG